MKLIAKIYPFLSLGVIEIGNLIDRVNGCITLFIFLLQGVIAVLTIMRLYKDVKFHKYKNLEKTEKETAKRYPFIFALFEYFKKKKQ